MTGMAQLANLLGGTRASLHEGCYTLATLTQIAVGFYQQVVGTAGTLLIGDSAGLRDWAKLFKENNVATKNLRMVPPPPPATLVMVGAGNAGFALVAKPLDAPAADDEARLFDVFWTLDPEEVSAFVQRLGGPAMRLESLSNAAMENLGASLLEFASGQHSALATVIRAQSDRLRNQEDHTRMIVHDMRAPLHTLQISIKTMLRHRLDPTGQTELLEVARDSAEYLLNMVNAVLETARMEATGGNLSLKPVRLSTIVQSVCEPLELAARADQAKIVREVAADLPVLHLDRGLMERVLTNLITNAIKYTPADGQITVVARADAEGNTEISVRDTGRGIAPDAQAQIFERFFQATESDRRTGMGIGLYFCRLAVEAHGGTIVVESELGHGSNFIVRLPARLAVNPSAGK